MKYRTIPKTNLSVSEISFGCMSLKGNNQKDHDFLINTAIENGINYFDTADLYEKGQNEIILGKAIKSKRNEIILATKVGNQWNNDGQSWTWNPKKSYILQAVDESLKRLQTDVIDIYQLHGGTSEDSKDEIIDAFETLVKQGKIKHYGISSIRPNIIKAYSENSAIVSCMTQYSLLDRRPEEETLNLLHKNDCAAMIRGALASGLIVDKPAKSYLNYSTNEIENFQEKLSILCGETQKSTVQLALQYILENQAVTTIVAGIRTIDQLKDLLSVFDANPLDFEMYKMLQELIKINYYEQHRN